MKLSLAFYALLLLFPSAIVTAAETATAKEEIKTLVLEDAKKLAKSPQPAPPKSEKPAPAAVAKSATPAPVTTTVATASATTPPAPELQGKLPTVEVNKNRVTILDHELHEQDRKMAFEAKNAKATELDNTLNSPAVNPTILGGYSSKVRTGLAQERLELMEFEKELTEAIAHAKTKEEKVELKKQLEDVRTMRRTLDRSGERKER